MNAASVRTVPNSDGAPPATDGGSSSSDANHILLLATWLSPAFPIGGFAYSHGLETVIADGAIANAAALEEWIALLVERGSGWCDAVLLAEAWRSVSEEVDARLSDVRELASALAPSRERHIETTSLGAAFLQAVAAGWPNPLLNRFRDTLPHDAAYPVAVGLAAATHGLPLMPTLAGFLNSFAGNLVSVAVRLVPLGQSEGLAVLGRLQPLALATAERAAASTLDDLGSAAILSDIAAMRHETLASRVFRS